MHGTQFAQFSAEVLRRGAAAVLPQHLPDHWLDALLEEADLLAPGDGAPEEGRPRAGVLGGPPGRRARGPHGATWPPRPAGSGGRHADAPYALLYLGPRGRTGQSRHGDLDRAADAGEPV